MTNMNTSNHTQTTDIPTVVFLETDEQKLQKALSMRNLTRSASVRGLVHKPSSKRGLLRALSKRSLTRALSDILGKRSSADDTSTADSTHKNKLNTNLAKTLYQREEAALTEYLQRNATAA